MKTAFLFLALLLFVPRMANAADSYRTPWLYKAAIGVLAHDYGPTSDRHENGIDPNLEIQFIPPDKRWWQIIGAPYPTLGIAPNFNGETSAAYAALTYDLDLSGLLRGLFAAGSAGIALHSGSLHKDHNGCVNNSNCGFGHRALPRFSAELGYKIDYRHGFGLFYDHMSHKDILPGENEGIDHVGLRYFYYFKR